MNAQLDKKIRRVGRLFTGLAVTAVLLTGTVSAFAQRGGFRGGGGGGFRSGGSFGGGGTRSFGGGGGSSNRSFGGSSGGGTFGGSRSSTFGGSRSSGGSGSFGRSGSFNSSNGGINRGYSRSTNMYTSPSGIAAPVRGYRGFNSYSFYWGAPAWYYYTPFHPAFYFRPPVYVGGYYEPGGFNFLNFFLSIFIFIFLIWLVIRIFSGGRGPRYTTYN